MRKTIVNHRLRFMTSLLLKRKFNYALAILLLLSFGWNISRADGIKTTITVGSLPQRATVTPDGSKVYVANGGSLPGMPTTWAISQITTSNFSVNNTAITESVAAPFGVAVTNDGTELWVTLPGASKVAVYDLPGLTLHSFTGVSNPISLGTGALPADITFKGANAYVTDQNHSTVIPITISTGTVQTAISVGSSSCNSVSPPTCEPQGIADAFNSTLTTHTIAVANFGDNSVSLFHPSTPSQVVTLSVGTAPYGVAPSSDGTAFYISNSGSGDSTGNFSVITIDFNNLANSSVSTPVLASNLTKPLGVTVKPTATAGDRIYTANFGDSATSIDSSVTKFKTNGTLKASVDVGLNKGSVGLAAISSDNFVYVVNETAGTVTVIDITL